MTETLTDELELLTRHGITKEPVFIYRYRDWRYSNLDDALAQARRDVSRAATK